MTVGLQRGRAARLDTGRDTRALTVDQHLE